MPRVLNSFKIRAGDKLFDYRLAGSLNLNQVKSFFQNNYQIEKLWNGTRHVLGILRKGNCNYFLKLSTTKGMSLSTENEYYWNNYFHKYFSANPPFTVPKNYDVGFYHDKYFYLITDYFAGTLLCPINSFYTNSLAEDVSSLILFSEAIQKMPQVKFTSLENEGISYQDKFITKVMKWFNDIPRDIRKKYKIEQMLILVKEGINELSCKPRHGDFTPWHIIKLSNSRLGLIDGEHALADSVENYDICYLLQRVFSVLKSPNLAQEIYSKLISKGYLAQKLKTVLGARAIGGFLDESLNSNPNYDYAVAFQDWVLRI